MAKLSEVEAAFAMLDTVINSVLDALDGLSAEELNWTPPVADSNSALVIATLVLTLGETVFGIESGVMPDWATEMADEVGG